VISEYFLYHPCSNAKKFSSLPSRIPLTTKKPVSYEGNRLYITKVIPDKQHCFFGSPAVRFLLT
jgi:hypothetical protein